MNVTRAPALLGAFAFSLAMSFGCGPEYPNCRNDDNCHDREYCVDGHCQQCRANTDCEAGQRCDRGACVADEAYECAGDADCGPGRACTNHRCVTVASTDTSTPAAATATSACSSVDIYFDFDMSTLSSNARDSLAQTSRCIQSEAPSGISVRGMTDPRGTEEYNFTLGEHRAHAVRDYLSRMGTQRDQIRTTSAGEEYAEGSDENGYAQDRRAEIRRP